MQRAIGERTCGLVCRKFALPSDWKVNMYQICLSKSARRLLLASLTLAMVLASTVLTQNVAAEFKAKDPGPRPNPATAIPNPVSGLNANETALFNESLLRVSELEGTCDTCAQQPQAVPPIDPDPKNPFSPLKLVNSAGMGPLFNAVQVLFCHSPPAPGGSAPAAHPASLIAHPLCGPQTFLR